MEAPQSLKNYSVSLHEEKGDKFQIIFNCKATDNEDAIDQAETAYPNGEILIATEE